MNSHKNPRRRARSPIPFTLSPEQQPIQPLLPLLLVHDLKRIALFRIAGTNSAQSALRACFAADVEHGPFVFGVLRSLQVNAFGFDYEYLVDNRRLSRSRPPGESR